MQNNGDMQIEHPSTFSNHQSHQNKQNRNFILADNAKYLTSLSSDKRASAREVLKQKQNEAKEKRKQEKIMKKMKQRQNLLKDKGIKMNKNEKDQLFGYLIEYKQVLTPQMDNCNIQIHLAMRNRNHNLVIYWRDELKKLQDCYAQFQQQSVAIKTEINDSNTNANTIDLHTMTLDEAVIALKNKISRIVSSNISNKIYYIKCIDLGV
jgi:hypothetical protein